MVNNAVVNTHKKLSLVVVWNIDAIRDLAFTLFFVIRPMQCHWSYIAVIQFYLKMLWANKKVENNLSVTVLHCRCPICFPFKTKDILLGYYGMQFLMNCYSINLFLKNRFIFFMRSIFMIFMNVLYKYFVIGSI